MIDFGSGETKWNILVDRAIGLVHHIYSIPCVRSNTGTTYTTLHLRNRNTYLNAVPPRWILSSWMAIPRWYMVVRLFSKLVFELCLAKSHWRFFWIDLRNIRLLLPLLQWRSRPSWQYNTACRSFAAVVDKLSQTWRKTEGTPWKRRYDLSVLSSAN